MEQVEAIVIGAGVVGLACARSLAKLGKETIIIERHDSIGSETSSRNSEVIHAGIYYAPGSLKAKLSVEGNSLLYRFCDDFNISYRKCGKLIVATSLQQKNKLDGIHDNAIKNGVKNLSFLNSSETRKIEPEIKCKYALFSPSTGIISAHDYMLALLADAENNGAILALNTNFSYAEIKHNFFEITINTEPTTKIQTNILINSGGLEASKIASQIYGFPKHLIPTTRYAKGTYFSLSKKSPFSHLIYPIPEAGGLGIHLTLDLAGQARFGPDIEWVNYINYDVDHLKSEYFYNAIKTYWPNIKPDMLVPGYSGIRPKIVGPGEADADYVIQGPLTHGIPGLINLFGIESPGLTSSLAIANEVIESLGI